MQTNDNREGERPQRMRNRYIITVHWLIGIGLKALFQAKPGLGLSIIYRICPIAPTRNKFKKEFSIPNPTQNPTPAISFLKGKSPTPLQSWAQNFADSPPYLHSTFLSLFSIHVSHYPASAIFAYASFLFPLLNANGGRVPRDLVKVASWGSRAHQVRAMCL